MCRNRQLYWKLSGFAEKGVDLRRAFPLVAVSLFIAIGLLFGGSAVAGERTDRGSRQSVIMAGGFPILAAGGSQPIPVTPDDIRPPIPPNILPAKTPWGVILVAALGLGFVAFLVFRFVLANQGKGSGRHGSRGGWVVDSRGIDEIPGGSADDNVAGGSRNFTGGGAEGTW
jgi:uncharacterized membrane protein YgcG